MKHIISGIINILISLFLFISIHTFLSPCSGVMEMPCGYSVKAANLILVILIILNIGKLFVRDKMGLLFIDIAAIAAGIELVFIPRIGRCQIASMSCNTKTFPALIVGGLLITILTAIFRGTDFLQTRR